MVGSPRSTAQRALTFAGLTGIVSLLIPFARNVSPIEAVADESAWVYTLPFFGCMLVLAASIRWIVWGSFTRAERAIAYALAAGSAALTVFVVAGGPRISGRAALQTAAEAAAVATLLLGSWLVARSARRGGAEGFGPVMALEFAYLGNGVLNLVATAGEWQEGAYWALATAFVYAGQIGIVSTSRPAAGNG